jgi:UDP-N-acetylglucosamine 2-epimerase (hydrolysing)
MRFEHFLSLLRRAQFIIGNSSSGVREAPHYGVPAINVGSRQNGRVNSKMVLDCGFESSELDRAIDRAMQIERLAEHNFGDGKSAERFKSILESGAIWNTSIQKVFYEGDLK